MEANNMKAMREALKEIANAAEVLTGSILDDPNANAKSAAKRYATMVVAIARAALAAPPRNCDVGTAEEQFERYRKQCNSQDCCDCPVLARWPLGQTENASCQLVWAQLPYKEGENK